MDMMTLEKVEVHNTWFIVYKLPNDVYAIFEPYHFQEVISYLIIGNEKALLFDTGSGISDISSVVGHLCDKEVLAINSHAHFDHVGCNHRFPEVMIYDDAGAIERLRRGYSCEELKPHAKRELFNTEQASEFEFDINNLLKDYFIPPSKPKAITDGYTIDLGNRRIKVIHTPGHSPESIMLHDLDNNLLFTGDSYYPAPLYTHYEGDFYRNSDLKLFANSMNAISRLADELVCIHPAHNYPVADPQVLKKAALALDTLLNGKVKPGKHLYGDLSAASLPNSDETVDGYVIPDDLYLYDFGEVKIISRKRH